MLRKLTGDEVRDLRVKTGLARPPYRRGKWTPSEVSCLWHGVVTHQLSHQALWAWCQTHGVRRDQYDIEAKLVEVNRFVPMTPYERAAKALAQEIALARSEARTAPLFRPPVKEIDEFARGTSPRVRLPARPPGPRVASARDHPSE